VVLRTAAGVVVGRTAITCQARNPITPASPSVVSVVASTVVQAPAGLQPLKLLVALVELVVAHGARLEAERVHGLDGRLVVERGRQQRRGPDDVTGGDRHGVALPGPGLAQVGGEVLHATGVGGHVGHLAADQLVVGHDAPAGAARRLEVPVEVVEGEDLEVERLVPGVGTGRAAGDGHTGAGGEDHGQDTGQASLS